MKKTVWKFPVGDWCGIPLGAKVLRAGEQNMVPFVWIEVDPDAEKEMRMFRVFGTGHDIPPGAAYVGGFTLANNGVYLEWHVYEVFE